MYFILLQPYTFALKNAEIFVRYSVSQNIVDKLFLLGISEIYTPIIG